MQHGGGANGGLQGAQKGLEREGQAGVGQRRDKEVKDGLGEGRRDELLSEGCKYKLPGSRGRVRGQVKKGPGVMLSPV